MCISAKLLKRAGMSSPLLGQDGPPLKKKKIDDDDASKKGGEGRRETRGKAGKRGRGGRAKAGGSRVTKGEKNGTSTMPTLETTDSPDASSSTVQRGPDVPSTSPSATSVEEEKAEKPIYDDDKVSKLSEYKPDDKRKDGLELKQIKTFCKEDVEIILQVVNDNEYKAALTFMHPPFENFSKPVMCKPGMIVGMFAERKVALVKTEPGLKCQSQLEKAVKAFPKAKYIVCVGVGYAYDKEKCKLADVLVADKICDFTNSKFDKHGKVENRGQTVDVMQDLKDIFCNIQRFDDFEVSDKGRVAKVHCGSLCSYPALFDNEEIRDKFRRQIPTKAIGGEMEGGVLLNLQQEGKIKGVIVIKGACDYGDGKKEKDWQFTAAMAALRYTKEKLEVPNYFSEEEIEPDEGGKSARSSEGRVSADCTDATDGSQGQSLDIPQGNSTQADEYNDDFTKPLDMQDYRIIHGFLRGKLENPVIIAVGVELGLNKVKLGNHEGPDKLSAMITSWLRGDEEVGEPTIKQLVEALEANGQKRLAGGIRKKYKK